VTPTAVVVLHDWSDALSTQILRNAPLRAVSARMILIEMVVRQGIRTPVETIDLTMLGMLTGANATEPEWRELLRVRASATVVVRSTPSPLSVIEARC